MIFLIRYWKYIALVLAVLSLLGALWYYGHTKYRQGYEQCTTEQAKAEIKSKETKDEIRIKNKHAPLSDIDKRLVADWLYGE